ncbi:thiolase family protein [Nocardia farcinica]|uniref:thiolase family protein n=1 Tax=Nocardia farcinica TaxID=37329 RepID=UPI000A3B3408|nr:thiolase family protein [Nocardia farcinica]MBA4857494.1 thiolase family protein [Nocardia farcinica]MBC9816207.1 thiolase family protein [Nocardia farcinica]MBF6072438.1 thiolase family protein [Nocardia farcinica]MBF6262390.1 thiolase family protein [Nocardia farcinica]MBF6280930.1 thiolase family protein [Nocardia farcinica]
MSDNVWIIGTSMTKFGRFPDRDLLDLAADATLDALADAGLSMAEVGLLALGNVYEANSHNGQRLQKQIGQTGIPVYNVVNACATGATAVRVAMMGIKAGECDIALAVGVEKMGKMGMLGSAARPAGEKKIFTPKGRYGAVVKTEGLLGTGLMPGVFAQAGTEYALTHGVTAEQFAKVAVKNHLHSTLNPLAQYRKEFSLEEVLGAEVISYPNTLPMCCPTGDGAAAVVLVSEAKLKTLDPDVRRRAVKISASVMTSDPWSEGGQVQPDVNTLTRMAADHAYEAAGVGPEDLDLVELHDCFATAELIHYDNLRLCEPGGAGDFIDSGAPMRDGKIPVNVSGGLLSKGHPIGATGIANLYEVATHLRGEAGDRQIAGARVGLTHVIGLASACAVHILEAPAA